MAALCQDRGAWRDVYGFFFFFGTDDLIVFFVDKIRVQDDVRDTPGGSSMPPRGHLQVWEAIGPSRVRQSHLSAINSAFCGDGELNHDAYNDKRRIIRFITIEQASGCVFLKDQKTALRFWLARELARTVRTALRQGSVAPAPG